MAKKLSPAVSDKYKVVNIEPGKYQFADFGTIDLCSITLEFADALFSAGFPYLQKKAKREKLA